MIGHLMATDAYEIQNCLIVPVQSDLYDDALEELKNYVLEYIHNTDILGVILDISILQIMDTLNLKFFINLGKMIHLMDKKLVILGFQPALAGVMSDFDPSELNKLTTCINLEAAINCLQTYRKELPG